MPAPTNRSVGETDALATLVACKASTTTMKTDKKTELYALALVSAVACGFAMSVEAMPFIIVFAALAVFAFLQYRK